MKPSGNTLRFFLPCLALCASFALAAELSTTAPLSTTPALNTGGGDALPADLAFPLTVFAEVDGSFTLAWELAEGPARYYLYRKSLHVAKTDGTVLALTLPEGEVISDEFFGESEVYFERLLARIPASALNATPGSTVELQLDYQGCVENVLCYPPQHKTLTLQIPE